MSKTLVATQTASNSSSLDFTSDIDSTYGTYEFHYINMRPQTTYGRFRFQANADGQTGFNETIKSTNMQAQHREDDTVAQLENSKFDDQFNGTNYDYLTDNVGTGSDEGVSGVFILYNPSDTTHYKSYNSIAIGHGLSGYATHAFVSGDLQATDAITEISFKFENGNINTGTIKMYGVS